MLQDQFDNMGIWGSVDEVERLLNQATEQNLPIPSEVRSRVRELVSYAKSHKACNPAFVSIDMLNEPLAYWQQAVQHLNYYLGQHVETYLNQAVTSLEGSLTIWARWPAVPPKGGAARLAREQYEQYAASLEHSNERLREKLAEVLSQTETQQALVSSRSEELAQELQAAKNSLAAAGERYQGLETLSAREIALISANFEKLQTGWDRHFNSFLEDRSKDFTDAAEPYLSRGKSILDEGNEHLIAIQKVREDVEGTASLAVGSILAKDHGSYAHREWLTGIISYVLGFVFLIAGGWVLWSTVHGITADQTVSWQFVALKAGLTGAAAAAATVAFRLGGQSLARSTSNKRQELELRSIGPFLAAVGNDEAAEQARIDYLTRTFGRPDDKPVDNDVPTLSVDQLIKLISALGGGKGSS